MTKIETGTIVALIIAIIGGTLYIGTLKGRVDILEGKENRIEEASEKALEEITEAEKEALAAIQETLGQKPKTVFGNWVKKEVNRAHLAESDGFVAAYTHSNDTTALSIRIGESEDDLGSQNTRSKASHGRGTPGNHGNGTVVPVRKGQYYLVNADAGSPNFVEAYWLPIEREHPIHHPL